MSRRKAIGRLYAQHRTEWDFGWHDPNPKWRKELRDLYPVEYVAAFHRRETPDMAFLAARRQRLDDFHIRLALANRK